MLCLAEYPEAQMSHSVLKPVVALLGLAWRRATPPTVYREPVEHEGPREAHPSLRSPCNNPGQAKGTGTDRALAEQVVAAAGSSAGSS
jgi:hypothetical protein